MNVVTSVANTENVIGHTPLEFERWVKMNSWKIVFLILLLITVSGCGVFHDSTVAVEKAHEDKQAKNPEVTVDKRSSTFDEYIRVQGSNCSEEEKVTNAVQTYFIEQLQARKNQIPPDWGYLFSPNDEGLNLYKYETGRLRYSLIIENRINSIITWYEFQPRFDKVIVNKGNAEVDVFNSAQAKFSNSGDVVETTGNVQHHLLLVKSDGRWTIQADKHDDEITRMYPTGTDWDQVIFKSGLPDKNY